MTIKKQLDQKSQFISGFIGDSGEIRDENIPKLRVFNDSEMGMFTLYKYSKSGRRVVLKALKEEYRGIPLYEEMLRKEYEIGKSLNHPNIREYFDLISLPKLGNCIEMEWVDGDTLDALYPECHSDSEFCDRIISQLLEAVRFIHLKQVVHRDLKPSNILVTHNGRNVKLIDFSLSDSDSHFVLKGNAGTAVYASPEQMECRGSDFRSDIYSLGVILSEMTDRRQICRVAERCMRRDPAHRYQDVDQLSKALAKQRRVWMLYLVGGLILAAAIAATCIMTMRPKNENPPVEQAYGEEYLDAETIDNLFRQATELLEGSSVTGAQQY